MTAKEALRIIQEKYHDDNVATDYMLDDGKYYICGYKTVLDDSCAYAVNKATGEIIMYFPPDHADAFDNIVEVKIE